MHTLLFLAFNLLNPTLTLEVKPIQELSLHNLPTSVTLEETSLTMEGCYCITTNESNKKIIGSLSTPLPEDTSLFIQLQAPTGASSEGKVTLSNQDTLLVSNISRVAEKNLNITYTISSTSPLPSGSYPNLVQFTLID